MVRKRILYYLLISTLAVHLGISAEIDPNARGPHGGQLLEDSDRKFEVLQDKKEGKVEVFVLQSKKSKDSVPTSIVLWKQPLNNKGHADSIQLELQRIEGGELQYQATVSQNTMPFKVLDVSYSTGKFSDENSDKDKGDSSKSSGMSYSERLRQIVRD